MSQVKQIMCMRRYKRGDERFVCDGKDCPLKNEKTREKKLKGLKEDPCYLAIWVPASFLSEAKNDQVKAARNYVKWLLSE